MRLLRRRVVLGRLSRLRSPGGCNLQVTALLRLHDGGDEGMVRLVISVEV